MPIITPGRSSGGGSASLSPWNIFASFMTGGSNETVPSGGDGVNAAWYLGDAHYVSNGQAPLFFDLTDPRTPVVLEDGNYTFNLEAFAFDGAASGSLQATLYVDTDGLDDGPAAITPLAATFCGASPSCTFPLAAGMKIQFFLYQSSGSNLTVQTWMQVMKEATS
jgi:hypothetical protein